MIIMHDCAPLDGATFKKNVLSVKKRAFSGPFNWANHQLRQLCRKLDAYRALRFQAHDLSEQKERHQ